MKRIYPYLLFLFFVLAKAEAQNLPPYVQGPYAQIVCAGEQVCFSDMRVSDKNLGDTVRVRWNYGIAKAKFSKKMVGKYEEWTLCWQTTQADASPNPYLFSVTAFDDADTSISSTRNFSITVKPTLQSFERVYTVENSGEVTMEVTNEKYVKSSKSWVPNYQWTIDFNWAKKLNGKSVKYKFDTPGLHIIMATGEFGNCLTEYFDTVNLITVYPTGINQAPENNFSIYPNPSSGTLMLTSSFSGGRAEIAVLDLLGKVLLIAHTISQTSIEIKGSADLPAGVYLVKVSANGAVQTLNWVKE